MKRNLQLPRSSRQETLETISRNRLALLFDPEVFELRPEQQRDKGIDVVGEIKQGVEYTGFRFAIQLKSTESAKKQKDGSVPYPIAVSNLNYLLNFGLPGYYILYDLPGDQFYIISVAEVYRELQQKYHPDQLPKTYKVKFRQVLDQPQLDLIYKETFETGTLLKKLNLHWRSGSGNEPRPGGLVIDELQDVYSVEQNIAFIEQFGIHLLNSHRFFQVVEIEQRTHPRNKASAQFNMICGIAYYHQASLFKAVELLKLAVSEIDTLHPEDSNMLSYTLLHAKYLLGMVDQQVFRQEKARLVSNEHAGTFLQLEHLTDRFFESDDPDQGRRIRMFYDEAMRIIAKHPDFHDMRVVAYAKVLNLEATLLLHELAKNALHTLGRKTDVYRDVLTEEWIDLDTQFLGQIKQLHDYALKHQNFLAISNLMMEQNEWQFRKIYHYHAFNNWVREFQGFGATLSAHDTMFLRNLLQDVDKITVNYDRLQHRENQFNSLRTRYEILHFLRDQEAMAECAAEMEKLIDTYDLNVLRRSFDLMRQGDMRHQKFFIDLAQRRAALDRIAINGGFADLLYGDVDAAMNAALKRQPKWSLTELLPLNFPEENTGVV
ncbi:DUF4365 domain-containing protein [Mucilaginibacter defluvii]|uniref:DUF4365 domain-containing protein n=1 Tax=Mucilaginibacter defluvii TaxID=1196019 RepID=A0ABP9FNF0_9SPHI